MLDLITSNKCISIDIKIDLSKLEKFNNNILNYLEKSVKHLRKDVLFIDVITKFNCYLININKLNRIYIKSLYFY